MSDWSVQPGNGPAALGPTASAACTADDPSSSFVHELRFTLPTHQQDSRVADGTLGEQEGKDLLHADEDTYVADGIFGVDELPNSRVQGSQMNAETPPLLGQESISPSGHGDEDFPANSSDHVQRNDSFYWHSPQTSASTSHDRDQNRDVPGTSSLLDATPEPQEQYFLAPPKEANPNSTSDGIPSSMRSALGSYGASALGFGGPSDWEHFGDYDGEEVDDTDLYLRPRSPAKQALAVVTPELPANPAPVAVQTQEPPKLFEESSQVASPIQPKALGSVAYDEPEANKVTHEVVKGRSMDYDIRDPEDVRVSEHLGAVKPHYGHHFPFTEQHPSPVRDSAPQLPELKLEQVQRKSETTPGSFEEHNQEKSMNVSFEPQAFTSSVVLENEYHVSAQNGTSRESATVDDELPVGKVLPPSDDHKDIGRPLVNDAANTQAVCLDLSEQDRIGPRSDIQDPSRESSTKRASLVSDRSVLSKTKESGGPYADLDPWAKASLNRYVAMLHEEARAPTDLAKLDMFKAFSRKEWRLRAVLYGADDEPEDDLFAARKDGPVQRANTWDFRRPASKALPALPSDDDQPTSEVDRKHLLDSPKLPAPSTARLNKIVDEGTPTRDSGDESYTLVEALTGRREQNAEEQTAESYSPGGRPIRAQARDPRKSITHFPPDTNNRHDKRHSIPSNDRKPAYIPFRYSQGYVDDADQPVDRRASFRPFAALKLEPVDDHAETAPEPVSEDSRPTSLPPNVNDSQPGETASSELPVLSPKQRSSETRNPWSLPTDQDQSLDLRRFERADFDPLIAVLPPSGYIPQSAIELASFQRGMNTVPDDFSFIHRHVVAWDTKTKKIRGEHEKERHSRQTESEQRIDALFNDDEIGYGDISELEEESRRAEAARKTSEDRAEYSTFVEEVFDVVWTRLHFEIDQLTPMYEEYTSLAHETLAGKDMFEATEGQHALAPTMSALLTLHQKLETRHQKAFEAVLERDRRLKKTEVAPLYTLGNVTKVKQLEKQFDCAEKKAIVDYCKQRDARANRLMDVLDQNTLRG